jgi:tryptophan synthase beta chain
MPTATSSPVSQVPDARGRFGAFGGRFVPETLMFALEQLDNAYRAAKNDPAFNAEFHRLLNDYVGRPSRL